MKLTVIVNNNSRIDKYLLSEPALCFYIETGGKNFLFDLGYSNIFIENANKIQIDLKNIDAVILSHGHNDHTGGLFHLKNYLRELREFKINAKTPTLTAHPKALEIKNEANFGNIGSPLSVENLDEIFKLNLTKEPLKLTENLYFSGEIQNNSDESCKDDISLFYKTNDGVVIITGCAHSGIENIVKQAQKITKTNKIKTIIGGFHLLGESKENIQNLCKFLKSNGTKNVYPAHCTDLQSKITMAEFFDIEEVCTGDVFEF